jgi:hypothetical protein
MPTSIRRVASDALLSIGACALVAMFAASAAAQTPATAPAPAAGAPAAEDRIKQLEERIIALEGQVRMLQQQGSAPAAPPPPTAATETTAQAAAQGQSEAAPPAEQPANLGGATGMAKALNPDIAIIGNFVASAGRNPIAGVPSFEMAESELSLQSVVDPYARGDFFISFGEEGVELEEGFITFTALPKSFVAKVGKLRSAFGKVNPLHTHVLPWVDRPMMTDNLVGGEEGISDAGISVSRIIPAPAGIFLEATGQVYRGDSSDVFEQSRKREVSTVAHLRGYRDITESTNLDLGFSFARGHNDGGPGFTTKLYGVDATFRWKPLRRSIYRSFIARTEFVWSQRQQLPAEQRAFGMYASGDYQLTRRWFVGGRFDWSDRARDAALTDKGGSFVVTYWPSEFAQLRGQYRHASYAEGVNANEMRFQVLFAIGAHGAHPF